MVLSNDYIWESGYLVGKKKFTLSPAKLCYKFVNFKSEKVIICNC